MIAEARLAGITVFDALTAEELRRLAAFAEEQVLSAGDTLIREGDFSTDLYVIEQGTADVVQVGTRISTLGAGAIVGEIGVVEKQQRTAAVVATSLLHVIRISHWEISRLPGETRAKLRTLADARHDADQERR